MAFCLSYNGNVIEPVYKNIPWTISDTSTVDYFEIDTYVNDNIVTLRLLQDIDGTGTVDLTGILRNYVESDASKNANIVKYKVVGKKFIAGVETSIAYTDHNTYVFNGVVNEDYTFDLSTYIINESDGKTGKPFLNNVANNLNIHYNATDPSSLLTLETFTGIYGMWPEPSVHRLNVVKYGTTVDTSIIYLGYSASCNISKIDISPKTLNIPYTCSKYTVVLNTNRSETKTINITDRKCIFDKYFRIMYIDRNGCTDYFNFDYKYNEEYSINKTEFNSSGTYKTYATSLNNNYTITTGWITDEESEMLRDLWISPSIYVCTPPLNYNFRPIILDVKNMEIKRNQNGLISYILTFKYAKEYRIQTH